MSRVLPVTISHLILALTAAGAKVDVAPADGSARYVATAMHGSYEVVIVWENDGQEVIEVRNILHVPSDFRSMSGSAALRYMGL